MRKILIYDDNEQWTKELKEGLEALPVLQQGFEVIALKGEKFKEIMAGLQRRQRQFREDGTWSDNDTNMLDEASIFVIDYDLFDAKTLLLTGEDVAYAARCFSKCGLIVALNQYYEVDFDLTLKGHIESFADLNIKGEHLNNPNLWGGTGEEFHPWYWPLLPRFQQTFDERVEDVKDNLDKPICDVLGFESEPFDFLPRSISQFIGDEPSKMTFREFVQESGNGIRHGDLKVLLEKSREAKIDVNILARVGAARISKWLERLVMPELDIIVDAPHLISRYPSLLGDHKESVDAWNDATRLTNYDELGLQTKIIEAARFKKEFWLSRPVWFWDKVRDNNRIPEVRAPWETFRPGWVFCEDISKFHLKEECKEFVAKVESPFTRRYVKQAEGKKYQPRVRLSL